jgi:hypothetical protein
MCDNSALFVGHPTFNLNPCVCWSLLFIPVLISYLFCARIYIYIYIYIYILQCKLCRPQAWDALATLSIHTLRISQQLMKEKAQVDIITLLIKSTCMDGGEFIIKSIISNLTKIIFCYFDDLIN